MFNYLGSDYFFLPSNSPLKAVLSFQENATLRASTTTFLMAIQIQSKCEIAGFRASTDVASRDGAVVLMYKTWMKHKTCHLLVMPGGKRVGRERGRLDKKTHTLFDI
jgi:hypothetical protein